MPYKIRELRKKKNMTQEVLCTKSGVSRQIVSMLESGNDVNTTTETLMRLANALDCRVTDIFCP